MESGASRRSGAACGVRPKRLSSPAVKIPTLASVRRTRYRDGACTPAAAANVSVSSGPALSRSAMPSRATTQIAREIQKPSACCSSASAGGVSSVLIEPTCQRVAVESASDEPRLDRHGGTIKQLLQDERLQLALTKGSPRQIPIRRDLMRQEPGHAGRLRPVRVHPRTSEIAQVEI